MKKVELLNQITVSLCAIAIIGTLFHVSEVIASPTQAPPTNDTDIILDISSTPQVKEGNLTVNSTLSSTTFNAGTITAPAGCVGGDCRSSWPSPQNPTPTLHEVLQTGYSFTGYWVYGSGSSITLGGQYRSRWPELILQGKNNCYWVKAPGWGGPNNFSTYGGAEYVVNGFNTDFWGNMREVQLCRLYTYTN